MTSLLKPGTKFGRYEIVSLLGAGGMGEVYLAREAVLDRKVALKILPEDLASNEQSMLRFIQEAKAASALNHPNIITIYDIGIAPGEHFIATEYIDGQTLRRRIGEEPLQMAKAIDIALQVASALSTAHAAGIIHRDIKPENIMLRRDGIVKVLDFGLAKLTGTYGRDNVDSDAATKAIFQTQPGIIVGTTAYMSPEQTRALDIDTRTDIWSLGVVLYEMLAGRTPFKSDTPSDTSAAILKTEPAPLTDYVHDIPFELERIVRKALQKDRDERYQGVKDFELDLKTLKRDLDLVTTFERTASGLGFARSQEITRNSMGSGHSTVQNLTHTIETRIKPRWLLLALVVLTAILISLGVYAWRQRKVISSFQPQSLSVTQIFTRKDELGESGPDHARFSPDGKFLVYSSTKNGISSIWLKQISGGEPFSNRSVEATSPTPIWSPDGQQIAYLAKREVLLGIWTMPAFAGSPTLLKSLERTSSRLVAWRENKIYFVSQGNLNSFDVTTQQVAEVTKFDPANPVNRKFSVSPNNKQVAYSDKQDGQYDLWAANLDGSNPIRITNDKYPDFQPAWTPDGKFIVYSSFRNGLQQIFLGSLEGGTPVQLSVNDSNSDVLDVSPDGSKILYATGREESDLWRVSVEEGQESQLTSNAGIELWPSVSPDNKTVVFQSLPAASGTTVFTSFPFVLNPGTGETRLAPDGFNASWSPDGSLIAFLRQTDGPPNIWTVHPDGGDAKALTSTGIFFGGYSFLPYNRYQTQDIEWSRDGKDLTYCAKTNGVANVWTIAIDGSAATQVSNNTDPALLFLNPTWSPDGKEVAWLAMASTPGKKTTWSIWLARGGNGQKIYEGESVLGIVGWSNSGQELIIKSIPGAGFSNIPATVTLTSISAKGGKARKLTELNASYFLNLQLSPAKNQIAFVTREDGTDSLRLVPATGGLVKTIITNTDSRVYFSGLVWSPDASSIYYGKQGKWSTLSMLDNLKSK